jgi:pimeloyl-ACP methyl ester carboxylesterase
VAPRLAGEHAVVAHDVTVVEVPGGHFLPEEAPHELVAALAAFLEDAVRRPRA